MKAKVEVIKQLEYIIHCLKTSDNRVVDIRNEYDDRVVDVSCSNNNGVDTIYLEMVWGDD